MEKTKKAGIYVRVSTTDQSTNAQESQLRKEAERRGFTIFKIYSDQISGATRNRPGLQQLLDDAKRRRFNVLLVWRFDRLARSLSQLVDTLELCRHLGIDFVSASENVDTGSPAGELVFQVFGAIAQFERTLISERVRLGIAHARERGKTLGRPAGRLLDCEERLQVARERSEGRLSLRQLAKRHGATVWQISQAIAENTRCLE
jgi:DNA invertase Pin-like site-specific DNA recombinase